MIICQYPARHLSAYFSSSYGVPQVLEKFNVEIADLTML
jgi:hypothetical protein